MRAVLILIFLSLALPALAQSDSRLQAMQTADASRGWEAVGRLNMDGAGFCTGTLISETRVLTAAHCLFDQRTGQRIDESRLEFLAGWRTGRAEASRAVRRAAIWPGFNIRAGAALANVPTDLALLELDRPIRTTGIQPFEVSSAPPRRAAAASTACPRRCCKPHRLAGFNPQITTRPSGTSTRSTSRSVACGSVLNSSVWGSKTKSRLAAANGKAEKSHSTAA